MLAVLAARRTGAPLPERRAPCLFGPRHGSSGSEVSGCPPGGVPRMVPPCAEDTLRAEPVPWWQFSRADAQAAVPGAPR